MANHSWALAATWLLVWSFHAAAAANKPGATPYTIDVWETDDGLPQNSVISMAQTRDGYLWLGTLNGLVRFDGIRFTVFDENNTPELNSSRIVSLFEDSRTNLWVGTETAGIARVANGRITSLGLGRRTREGRLVTACEDSTGAVWLYTADGQLWRYRDGVTNVFSVPLEQASACRALIIEPSGMLWVGTDHHLFGKDPTKTLQPPELSPEQQLTVRKLDFLLASREGGYWRLADGRVQKWRGQSLDQDWGRYPWGYAPVSAACEDRQGNLVVGTLGAGLFWLSADGKVRSVSTNQGLSNNYVLSLHVDHEGSLWVGTDGGGLNRVKRQIFDVLEGARGLVVQSVCEDAEGGLWFGSNGDGAGYWKHGELQRFGYAQGLANVYVWAVFADRERRVWAGTRGGLFQFHEAQFQRAEGTEGINPDVLAIHQDRQGRLWLGTQRGLARRDADTWKVFTTREGLSADEVRALADDREGNLWIGTRGGGLTRLRDGQFSSFHKKDGLASEDISALWVDEDGVLWIGTFGSGLGRLYRGHWTRYTKREGLLSNSVSYLLDDGQGYLWIGSNAGLMRVPKKALNSFAGGLTRFIPCRAYGKADGLPRTECTLGSQPAACRTRDGRLWFPTIQGLVSVDPGQLDLNTNPPPVVIESVFVDGQSQNPNSLPAGWPEAVIVEPDKERLEVHYTSLNLAAPERARFKYRLEGHETAWTEAGSARLAHYSKLPPGHYRFQVTACNEDGVWNETPSLLALVVQPPFWRTWWFLAAVTVGSLGTTIALVRYLSVQKLQRQLATLRQQEALEKERARIARDIHDQLGASLTQVSLLGELVESDKDSPDEVAGHARQITQTARDTTRVLDEIVWTVNPSNDTLDGLITYVCQCAQEYLEVAGLRYRLDVPGDLPSTPISPEIRHNVFLAAKEAVTNVVRHARASSVWVRLKLGSGTFALEIQDDGRGPAGKDAKAAQSRNGLPNMRKRMEDVGGTFSIEPAEGGGTLVRLTAPVGNR